MKVNIKIIMTLCVAFIVSTLSTTTTAYTTKILNATPQDIEVDLVYISRLCKDNKSEPVYSGKTREFTSGACLLRSIDVVIRNNKGKKVASYISSVGRGNETYIVYGPFENGQYGITRDVNN
jgi:hypothetical protein